MFSVHPRISPTQNNKMEQIYTARELHWQMNQNIQQINTVQQQAQQNIQQQLVNTLQQTQQNIQQIQHQIQTIQPTQQTQIQNQIQTYTEHIINNTIQPILLRISQQITHMQDIITKIQQNIQHPKN